MAVYKVYFEIHGKKLCKEVIAETPYSAIIKIESEKYIIYKTELVDNKIDEGLEFLRGIFNI